MAQPIKRLIPSDHLPSRESVLALAFSLLVILSGLGGSARAQTIRYVDVDAAGANDGTNWNDAFIHLQDALAVAVEGDEVWVAEGVYRPDQGAGLFPGDRTASFHLRSGVSLHGGFVGSERSREERHLEPERTVLSGDLTGNDRAGSAAEALRLDNAQCVVRVDSLKGLAAISRLSIKGGSGPANPIGGAGGIGAKLIDALLLLEDIHLSDNGGWAIAVGGTWSQTSSLRVSRTIIDGDHGFGISAGDTNLELDHVSITLNVADGFALSYSGLGQDRYRLTIGNSSIIGFGGSKAVSARLANVTIWNSIVAAFHGRFAVLDCKVCLFLSVNNVFHHNYPREYGPILLMTDGNAKVANTAFVSNSLHAGASVTVSRNPVAVVNSMFIDNTSGDEGPDFFRSETTEPSRVSVASSMLTTPLPTWVDDMGGNVVGDSPFIDLDGPDNLAGTSDDDFSISMSSIGIDGGSITLLPRDLLDVDEDGDTSETWPVDLLGNPRIIGGSVDMGPVEVGSTGFPAPGIEVLHGTLSVFPNPVRRGEVATLVVPSYLRRLDVRIFDALGRPVETVALASDYTSDSVPLRTAALPPGLYIIQERTVGTSSSFVVVR